MGKSKTTQKCKDENVARKYYVKTSDPSVHSKNVLTLLICFWPSSSCSFLCLSLCSSEKKFCDSKLELLPGVAELPLPPHSPGFSISLQSVDFSASLAHRRLQDCCFAGFFPSCRLPVHSQKWSPVV